MDVRPDHHPTEFRGIFRTDTLARSLYSQGAGISRVLPSAVAVPADADDAAQLVRWARRTGHSLIPRGSGSGMAGGAVGPHVVTDLSRLDHIGTIDIHSMTVRAGAGAICAAVDSACGAYGLRFPVDPSSAGFCTIGGMAGTNAAGSRTLRFGAMRKWVNGIRCVFDDGSDAWIRRNEPLPLSVPAVARLVAALDQVRRNADLPRLKHAVRKESSGYGIADALSNGGSLVDLLVGSEGTLALFTEIELLLAPRPQAAATLLAQFDSLVAASACAQEFTSAGAAACEMLDRTYLEIARRSTDTGISAEIDAVLLVEIEGESPDAAASQLAHLEQVGRHNGAVALASATTVSEAERLWGLRHSASPTLAGLPPSLQSMQIIEDGCVPPDRFPEYVLGVRAALSRQDTVGAIFGHAGDAHAHVNPLIDLTHPKWRDRVEHLFDDVVNLTARLGGTLAGEHGDGRLRAPRLGAVWPTEALAAFANIKDAADPAGVFNRGCKVADASTDLGDIRYDPALPALPDEAAAALASIERDRAWHRFRLAALGSTE